MHLGDVTRTPRVFLWRYQK